MSTNSHTKFSLVSKAIGIPTAMILSAGLIWSASQAAFVDTTDNRGNSWDAGGVTLSDDDSAGVMFSATALAPGDTAEKCIAVEYDGTVESSVKFYTENVATTNALSSYLDITVTQGSGSTFTASPDCTGFVADGAVTPLSGTLASLGTTRTNFGNGYGTWTPNSSNSVKVYRISWTMNASAPQSTQGGSADADFVWEAQSS